MSIFDTNTKYPLEALLDDLEEIVGDVVSQELCHYNADPDHLVDRVCNEFRREGFWLNRVHPDAIVSDWAVWKVECVKAGYRRNIPFYKFYILCAKCDDLKNEEIIDVYDIMIPSRTHLFELQAGVSGIIHECI